MAGVAKKAASAPSAKKDGVLKVVAPLVQLHLGEQVLHLRNGDIVPDGASDEWVAHHKGLGFVASSEAPTEFDEN